MSIDQFKATLSDATAPADFSAALRALWEDAKGRWDAAHKIAQDIDDDTGAWVHAYLHRKEGDLSNAAYWYRQARQPVASDALDAEWTRLVTTLLDAAR
jgi:hypothetical protein